MLQVSSDFIRAVREKERQICFLHFEPIGSAQPNYISNDDIDSTNGAGLTVEECLNGDTELTMGKAVEAQLNIDLINDDMRFRSFGFNRRFKAFIGVMVEKTRMVSGIRVGAEFAVERSGLTVYGNRNWTKLYYVSGGTTGYITPSSRACALLVKGDVLCLIDKDGNVFSCYTMGSSSLTPLAEPLHFRGFMRMKFARWAEDSRSFRWTSDGEIREYSVDGAVVVAERFETVSMGCYIGKKPKFIRTRTVAFEASDYMSRFDVESDKFLKKLTFPMTLKQIFLALCDHVGVTGSENAFPNHSKSYSANPFKDDAINCRDILGYIAEAACSYAIIDRNGVCKMRWFSTPSSQTSAGYQITKEDYFDLEEADYEVPRVTRVNAYDSESGVDFNVPADASFTGTGSQRNFTLPKACYNTPKVRVAGVIQTEGTDFQYDNTTGVIRFRSAPTSGAAIEVDCTGPNNNVYEITDNPCLAAASASEISSNVTTIYDRLNQIGGYRPTTIEAESVMATEIGDILSVEVDDAVQSGAYSISSAGDEADMGTMAVASGTRQFPVFTQTTTWSGFGKTTMSYEGDSEKRSTTAAQRAEKASAQKTSRRIGGGGGSGEVSYQNLKVTAQLQVGSSGSGNPVVITPGHISTQGAAVRQQLTCDGGGIIKSLDSFTCDDQGHITLNFTKTNYSGGTYATGSLTFNVADMAYVIRAVSAAKVVGWNEAASDTYNKLWGIGSAIFDKRAALNRYHEAAASSYSLVETVNGENSDVHVVFADESVASKGTGATWRAGKLVGWNTAADAGHSKLWGEGKSLHWKKPTLNSPGVTGESLHTLTESVNGLNSKVYVTVGDTRAEITTSNTFKAGRAGGWDEAADSAKTKLEGSGSAIRWTRPIYGSYGLSARYDYKLTEQVAGNNSRVYVKIGSTTASLNTQATYEAGFPTGWRNAANSIVLPPTSTGSDNTFTVPTTTNGRTVTYRFYGEESSANKWVNVVMKNTSSGSAGSIFRVDTSATYAAGWAGAKAQTSFPSENTTKNKFTFSVPSATADGSAVSHEYKIVIRYNSSTGVKIGADVYDDTSKITIARITWGS